MPNYNHAPYLKERMDSILAQDYPEMEVIVLDDASVDDSVEILQSYKVHPKVKTLIVNQTNSGNTFLQWERGLIEATGEYVWIAESDDVAEPNLLSRLVDALERENAVVAFSQSKLIDEQGRSIPRLVTAPFLHSFAMDGKEYATHHLLGENTISNASAVLFRRDVANVIDLNKVAEYRASGDRLFWIQMVMKGKVAFVAEPLNGFRQHTHKVSISAAGKGVNCIQDHRIFQFVRPQLPLTVYDMICICGYHWQAMHMPWVTADGLQAASEEWQQEPYFGRWSWIVYKCHRAIIRLKGACFI